MAKLHLTDFKGQPVCKTKSGVYGPPNITSNPKLVTCEKCDYHWKVIKRQGKERAI